MPNELVRILRQPSLSEEEKIATLTLHLNDDIHWFNVNSKSTTLLQKACKRGSLKLIEWILSVKPDLLHAKSAVGANVLFYTVKFGREDLYDYFKQLHPDLALQRNKANSHLLHYAAFCPSMPLMNKIVDEFPALINEKNHLSDRPLHDAAAKGTPENIRLLSQRGADINAISKTGYTAVHFAASNGKLENVIELQRLGCDLNVKDNTGYCPIHFAAETGQVIVIQWLIENGVSPQCTTGDLLASTPLHLAAENDQLAVLQWYFTHGFDLEPNDASGFKPLHRAALNGAEKVIAWLVEKDESRLYQPLHHPQGYTLTEIAAERGDVALLRWLLSKGIKLSTSSRAYYPIHFSARSSYRAFLCAVFDNIRFEIKNAGIKSEMEYTPAMSVFLNETPYKAKAESYLHLLFVRILRKLYDHEKKTADSTLEKNYQNVVKHYQSAGCWLEQPTEDAVADRPVHIAAKFGNIDMLKALAEANVTLEIVNKHGDTPLTLAIQNAQNDCVTFLLPLTYPLWTKQSAQLILLTTLRYFRWELFQRVREYDEDRQQFFKTLLVNEKQDHFLYLHALSEQKLTLKRLEAVNHFLAYLIENSVSLQSGNEKGETVLHRLIHQYKSGELDFESLTLFITLLYDQGFDPSALNNAGQHAFAPLWQPFFSNTKEQQALEQLLVLTQTYGYATGLQSTTDQLNRLHHMSVETLTTYFDFLLDHAPDHYAVLLLSPLGEENVDLLSNAIQGKEIDKINLLAHYGFFLSRSLTTSQMAILSALHQQKSVLMHPFLALNAVIQDEEGFLSTIDQIELGQQAILSSTQAASLQKLSGENFCCFVKIISCVLLSSAFPLLPEQQQQWMLFLSHLKPVTRTQTTLRTVEHLRQLWLNAPDTHPCKEIMLKLLHNLYLNNYQAVNKTLPLLSELCTYSLLSAGKLYVDETTHQACRQAIITISENLTYVKQARWSIYRKFTVFSEKDAHNSLEEAMVQSEEPFSFTKKMDLIH